MNLNAWMFVFLSGGILFTSQNEQVGPAKYPNLDTKAINNVNMLYMIVYKEMYRFPYMLY